MSKNFVIDALVTGSKMSDGQRGLVYMLAALLALTALWAPALFIVITSKPTYTSKWTLILPGAGSGQSINLESIGQASAMTTSPYAGTSLDPKVNYKAIAESLPVIARAAESLSLAAGQFNKPKIKLVDQSTLMYFDLTADSGQLAYDKSYALYNALQEKLTWLRNDESMRREKATRVILDSFSTKLTNSQASLLDFRSSASIVSMEQFDEITLSIERMRGQHSNLLAELSGLEAHTSSLGNTLGIAPLLAADAMSLQQDQLFQKQLKAYAENSAKVTEYTAKWGNRHPKLVAAIHQQKQSHRALLQRSKLLLRKPMPVDQQLTLGLNDNRTGLFQELVQLNSKVMGMRSKAQALSKQIELFQLRLENTNSEAAKLEDLQRKQQVATAVFTTALAKLDIGKSDAFSSYPLLQMLAEPTMPTHPDMLKTVLALGGAGAGSLFCLIGLGLLWIRKPYLRRILTKS